MSKMVSVRVDEDLLDWATAYAEKRGVSRSALLEGALVSFREDCKAGVPELRERARRVAAGPAGPKPTREDFARATAERTALFSTLRCPDSITGKVAAKKAYSGS